MLEEIICLVAYKLLQITTRFIFSLDNTMEVNGDKLSLKSFNNDKLMSILKF